MSANTHQPPPLRSAPDASLDQLATMIEGEFRQLQHGLRKYSRICRTRFDDPYMDPRAGDMAEDMVEDALLQFKEMVSATQGDNVNPRSLRLRNRRFDRGGPDHPHEDYPHAVSGFERQVVRHIPHTTPEEFRVVPGDGDLLLRQAIVIDHWIETVSNGILLYASLMDGDPKELTTFRGDVIMAIEKRIQGIAQDDRRRSSLHSTRTP